MESMIGFVHASLSRRCFLQTFFHGNIDEATAKRMQSDMKKLTRRCKPLVPKAKRVRSLPVGAGPSGTAVKLLEPNSGESNSAVVNTYQLGSEERWDALERTCQTKVMAALTGSALYEELRTVEQLGYIVFSGPSKTSTMLNFVIIVQGTKNSPEVLDERIEAFVKQEYKKLQSISEEKFSSFVASEISRLKAPYKTLTDESSAYWSEIEGLTYLFARPFKEIEQFEKITVQGVTALWGESVVNPTQRRKLSVQIYGNTVPPPSSPDTDEGINKLRGSLKLADGILPVPDAIADSLGMAQEKVVESRAEGNKPIKGPHAHAREMTMLRHKQRMATGSTGGDDNGGAASGATGVTSHHGNRHF